MADKISKERRSANMSAIRSKDTEPEMQVRRLLHSLGYRFRLHRKDLPGKPDIVLPGKQAVIEVRGCFWHVHPDPACKDARSPSSNKDYWSAKLDRNVQRDAENLAALERLGWRVLVLWECEVSAPNLTARLRCFLGPPRLAN